VNRAIPQRHRAQFANLELRTMGSELRGDSARAPSRADRARGGGEQVMTLDGSAPPRLQPTVIDGAL
jgi:hypothetical protein